jgi:CHAT domain-containing protein
VAKGFDANRQNVLTDRLAKYRILHFATHGLINTEHPELSGILLSMAKPDGTPENGYLQLHDIYNLNISADLTVLSACDTALGKDIRGEGLVGLTRGFIYAGSKSVVASLWKVDDRATAVLMKHFYGKMLHDGLTPAAALRSAKEIVRKQPGWSAPYFWAGFVIQGEYRDPIAVDHERSLQSVAVVFPTLLFVIAAVMFVKHYRGTAQTNQKNA